MGASGLGRYASLWGNDVFEKGHNVFGYNIYRTIALLDLLGYDHGILVCYGPILGTFGPKKKFGVGCASKAPPSHPKNRVKLAIFVKFGRKF